jgi:AmmeMemoRadiSam system protein B
MPMTNDIRQAAVAGMFYPAEKKVLSGTLRRLLDEAPPGKPGRAPVAIISPHAGYQYSGATAAHGFRLLDGLAVEDVVIVAPSHREYFDGVSVFSGRAYRTPLGELAVAEALRTELLAGDDLIEASTRGHGQEHAIEVQLPFVQSVLGKVRILPIVIGDQRREYCYHLGERLGRILAGKNSLMIASTDLSHYHTYDVAEALDKVVIDDIAAFDDERLMDDLLAERAEACGGGPAVAVLAASKRLGADSVQILAHCNSGDVTGDRLRVVGYLSAAVLRTA